MRAASAAIAAVVALAVALAGAGDDAHAQSAPTIGEVTMRAVAGGVPAQVDAGVGASVSVSIMASGPVTVSPDDVSFFAESGASRVAPTSVTGAGTEWEARLLVAETHAEGPVAFWITARAASGAVTVTHEDVAGHRVEIDRTRPLLTAEITSPTTTVVRLDEALSPLVAQGRELDVSRWCMTESRSTSPVSNECQRPASTGDLFRDVSVDSATVTRTGDMPEVTLVHDQIHNINTIHVIFDPASSSTPLLLTDSALNLPDLERNPRILARPAILNTPDVPFRPLYWGSDYMAILVPATIGNLPSGQLVPGEWRVEHGAATPGDTSNDIALVARPANRPESAFKVNIVGGEHYDADAPAFKSLYFLEEPRLLFFGAGAAVPDGENLHVTYLDQGATRMAFTDGPEIAGGAQVAVNPTTLPASLVVGVLRDSGSGLAAVDSPARVGDRLAISLELRAAPPAGQAPTYSFHGAAAAPMTQGADRRTWSAEAAVVATTPEGPVEFDVMSPVFGAPAVAYDESDVTDASSASVDRTPPAVRTATLVGDRELHVVFGEPVTHTALEGIFAVTRDTAAVTITGTAVDAASGAYVTTLAADAPPGSTHVLTMALGAISDAAGNAAPTSITVAADAVPPSATLLSVAVLRDGTSERTGPNAAHARPGDTVRVTLELDEATSAQAVPTVRFFDQRTPVAMMGQPGDTVWAADYAIPGTRTADDGSPIYPDTPEGAVELDIVALDYAGNALAVSESGITDMSSAVIDVSPPARPSAEFASDALSVTLAFAEALDADTVAAGAFAVRDADGAAVAQPSPPAYTASPPSVLLSLQAVPDGAYTVEIAGTLTDRAGNAYRAGDVALPTVDSTAPTVMGIATESATTTVIEFGEEVTVSGNAAQRARHWTVTDDGPPGGAPTQAEERAVSAVEAIGADGMAADSGTRVRLTHATLGMTDSTPTVAYTPATSDADGIGDVALGRVTDTATPLLNALAAFAAREASDGAPPRAESVEFTAADTVTITLSEGIVSDYLPQVTMSPGLGRLAVTAAGTALTIEGSMQATDGTEYTVRVPSLVTDRACIDAQQDAMCAPNAFSGEAITVTHNDAYPPGLVAGSASFATASLLTFMTSEPLDAATISQITLPAVFGTVTATQSGTEVRLAFTGTPVTGTEYTIGIPSAVTDTADPPNRFGGLGPSQSLNSKVIYRVDTADPTVASARLTGSTTIDVEFSEPVRGTASASDWEIRVGGSSPMDKNALPGIDPLDSGVQVSAQGLGASASVTIPEGSPVNGITLHFGAQPTDTVMFVRYVGTTLSDRAGNLVTVHAGAADSVEAADAAGPEPETVHVDSSRDRQDDAVAGFGTLLVRPGDTVTFDVSWSVINAAQDASTSGRIANPTIEYLGPGTLHAMQPVPNTQRTAHTFTIPAGAPEGPFMPSVTASDMSGNVATHTRAAAGGCDTFGAYRASVPDSECATRSSTVQSEADERLLRVYPAVDATAPAVVSARTVSKTATLVTFGEPVAHAAGTDAERAAHWSMMSGDPPARVMVNSVADGAPLSADDAGDLTLRITHDEVPADATPTLTYTLGAGEGRVIDRVGHDLASTATVAVADGVPPSIESAAFGGSPPRTLTVTFSEALAPESVGPSTILVERGGTELAGTTIAHVAGSPEAVTIEFPAAAAAPDGEYTLRARGGASGISDAADPANRPAEDLTRTVALNAEAPHIVEAVTRLRPADATQLTGYSLQGELHFQSKDGANRLTPYENRPSTTEITLSEPVTATPSGDSTPATPAEISGRWGLEDSMGTLSINSVSVSGSTVTITHASPRTTAAALSMTYDDSAGAGRLVGTDGTGLAMVSTQTTDGVAPLWSARLAGPDSVIVSFSEPVRIVEEDGGPVSATGRWFLANYAPDATGTPDSANELIDPQLFDDSGSYDVGVDGATLDASGTRLALDPAAFVPGGGGSGEREHLALGSAALPWAKYYPGAQGLSDTEREVSNMIADLAGNALVPRAVRTADGIRPTLSVDSFDGTDLVATASRGLNPATVQAADLALGGPGASTASRAPATAAYDTGTGKLTLTFSPALGVPGLYRLGLATDAQGAVTGDIRDTVTVTHPGEAAAGNLLDTDGAVATLASTSAPTIASVRTLSPTLTRVNLSAPVEGMTVPAQWGLAGEADDVAVTGVAAGEAASVGDGAAAEPTREAAAQAFTLLHDAQATDWLPRLSYDPDAGGVASGDRLRDVSGMALAGVSGAQRPTATDGAPPRPASAQFDSPMRIDLSFSEDLHEESIASATYAVTAPSGVTVGLAETPASHVQGSSTVTLGLAGDAAEHGTYRITVSGLADTASDRNTCAPAACAVDAERAVTLPALSSLGASVLDPTSMAAKAANAETAATGDIVRLRLELSGVRTSPGAAPDASLLDSLETPLVGFYDEARTTEMTDASPDSSPGSVWTADYTVPMSPQREGPAEFEARVSYGIDTLVLTRADLTRGTAVTVDTAPPSISSAAADPLYTRTEAAAATTGLGAASAAGAGSRMLVVLTASEPLAGVAPSDATIGGAPATGAASDHASRMLSTALPANTYVYSRLAAADEAEGPLSFSITVRDAVGNSGTITNNDIPDDGDAATGYLLEVDRTPPEVSGVGFASRTQLDLEFDEPVRGVPATLALERVETVPGTVTPVTATVTHADGEATATLAVPEVERFHPDVASWRLTVPATVLDMVGNAYATPGQKVAVSTAGAPSITGAETLSTARTRVALSAAVAALGTEAATASSQVASRWTVGGQAATGAELTTFQRDGGTVSAVLLDHGPLAGSDATPDVAYDPAGTAAGRLVDAVTGVFYLAAETRTVTATDSAPPEATAAFTSDTVITVRTDVEYSGQPAISAVTFPAGVTHTVTYPNPTTVVITLAGTVADDDMYKFSLSLSDKQSPPNTATTGFTLVRDTTTSTFASAKTLSHTQVEVTFAPGTTRAGTADLDAARWVAHPSGTCESRGGDPATATAVTALAGGKVTLTFGGGILETGGRADTSARPPVSYTRTDGAGAEFLNSVGVEMESICMVAFDGAPPAPLSATLTDAAMRSVAVQMSEAFGFGSTTPGSAPPASSAQFSLLPGGRAAEAAAPSSFAFADGNAALTLEFAAGAGQVHPIEAGTVIRYDASLGAAHRATDAEGNILSQDADLALGDAISPRVVSARTASATTTEVTYDEDIALRGDVTGLWTLTVSGDDTQYPVSSAAIKPGSPRVLVLTHADATTPLTHTATSTATATYVRDAADARAVTDTSGNPQDNYATPMLTTGHGALSVADGIAPLIASAATSSATSTLVTLSEPVQASSSAAASLARHWSVSETVGSSPVDREVTSAVISGSTVTLTHAGLGSTGATPSVTYAASVDSDGDGDIDADDAATMVTDAATPTNALAGVTATASDGAPPVITAAFASATSIRVSLSEPIQRTGGGLLLASNWMVTLPGQTPNLLRATGPVAYAAGSAEREITLRLVASASATRAHEVTLPTGITDRSTDPNAYAYPTSRKITATALGSPTFTARATAADKIEVTFAIPVRRVGEPPLPLEATAWHVHPTSIVGLTTERIPVTGVSVLADNSLTLTLSQADPAHRSTSKTPLVLYNRGSPEIESTLGVGLARNTSDVASDATPPALLQARATSTTVVEVTMSEGVSLSGDDSAAARRSQWSVATGAGTFVSPSSVSMSASAATITVGPAGAWATGAPPEVYYRAVASTPTQARGLLVDGAGNRLAASSLQAADAIPPVIEAAAELSTRRIGVTLSEAARFDSDASTAADRAAHWSVAAGGSDRAAETVVISTSDGRSTVTVMVAEGDRWTGGQSPTVSYSDTPADGGRVTDSHGNHLAARSGVAAADQSAPELESARTVDLGRTEVVFSRPVVLTEGTDAQVRGHWTVSDDPDGGGTAEAQDVMINSVTVVSGTPEKVMVAHGALSGPGARPTISYDPATSASGLLVREGQASVQVDGFDFVASDGIPPRLVGDPAVVSWNNPTDPGQNAIRFTFDEPMNINIPDPTVENTHPTGTLSDDLLNTIRNQKTVGHRSQVSPQGERYHNIPSGNVVLGDETDLTVPDRWLPSSPFVQAAHLDDSRKVLTLRLPPGGTELTDYPHPVAVAITGDNPHHNAVHYLYDDGANRYIPDASRAHERFTIVRDFTPPTFVASVDSARQVRVVYNEPVKISDTQLIQARDWRIDTTPGNSGDNTDGSTYLTPADIAYSFDEFETQDLVHHGDLGRQSRLTILLAMGQDIDAAADLNVVSLEQDVEDARGNGEARDTGKTTRTYEYRPGGSAPAGRDTAAPTATSLEASVERLIGQTTEFAARDGQFAHHARAGDRVRVAVTLDEPVPLAGARMTVRSTGPTVSDTIMPRLVVAGNSRDMGNMAAATSPPFRVVLPMSVTDQDGMPFAANTAHAVTYAPAAPAFSNAMFDSPTRLFIDVSEPLDDTTLTPDTPATGDTALVRGSVHVEGLGTFAVHRDMGRVVVTTVERALPGSTYTIRIADTVKDADGDAAAAASLSVTYPESPTLTARFTERDTRNGVQHLIGIKSSEWLDWGAIRNAHNLMSVSTVGTMPETVLFSQPLYAHPYLILVLRNPAEPGTYEVSLPENLRTFAGTPVQDTIQVERHAGGYTPAGAPTASNVRFFGPQHIQLDLDQQPDPATLGNIEVPGLGVKSWSREGLTITLALEGRADRVAWEGTWTVPAEMADGMPFGGVLGFGVMAPDSAGNVSDIGQDSLAEGAERVVADTGAPEFEAHAVSDTRTRVTFAEPVRGVIAASEWCVGGAESTGISADGASFAPALPVEDGQGVTAGQSFTISHAPSGGAAPEVVYRPGGACSQG
ncbi:MAG: hypothetical protein OXU37_07170 [Thaumarchaeota archaeon]|nr:hypothetical protein [Nitrososphaerota archaeon]